MIDFIVRLVQWHETFRKAELEALAVLANVHLQILDYSDDVRLFASKQLFNGAQN